MIRIAVGAVLLGVAVASAGCGARMPARSIAGTGSQRVPRGTTNRWTFDEPAPPIAGTGVVSPARVRVFDSLLGAWDVHADGDAASGGSDYRQTRAFMLGDEPRVLVQDLSFGDMDLTVRCRPDGGIAAEGCGLVFDADDVDQFLVVRADALAGAVRLVHEGVDGAHEIAEASALVTPHVWHTLTVHARGERIFVEWDGAPSLSAVDWSRAGGRIGLATLSDGTASFDDLAVTAD